MHSAWVASGSLLAAPVAAPTASALLPTPESPYATTAAVAAGECEQFGCCIAPVEVEGPAAIVGCDVVAHRRDCACVKVTERLPSLPVATRCGVEGSMCVAPQQAQVDRGGLRRVLDPPERPADRAAAKRRTGPHRGRLRIRAFVTAAQSASSGVSSRGISTVSRDSSSQVRCSDDLRAGIGDAKIHEVRA